MKETHRSFRHIFPHTSHRISHLISRLISRHHLLAIHALTVMEQLYTKRCVHRVVGDGDMEHHMMAAAVLQAAVVVVVQLV
jgi:hypothetical protein